MRNPVTLLAVDTATRSPFAEADLERSALQIMRALESSQEQIGFVPATDAGTMAIQMLKEAGYVTVEETSNVAAKDGIQVPGVDNSYCFTITLCGKEAEAIASNVVTGLYD